MNHEMRLLPKPFESILSGTKTVEIRLNDEKRRRSKSGISSPYESCLMRKNRIG